MRVCVCLCLCTFFPVVVVEGGGASRASPELAGQSYRPMGPGSAC